LKKNLKFLFINICSMLSCCFFDNSFIQLQFVCCPVIVDFPESTCPIKIILTFSFFGVLPLPLDDYDSPCSIFDDSPCSIFDFQKALYKKFNIKIYTQDNNGYFIN
jgi:hypothetical protein